MSNFQDIKALKIIEETIDKLKLDLTNYNVLTEVGSKFYKNIPVIASLANAKRGMAWTRDFQYGSAEDNIKACLSVLEKLDMVQRVEFYSGELNIDHLENADIITNSGFLRPLNIDKLKHCKYGAVIPLMFEKWELRETNIDISYCNQKDIKVAGTWEGHLDINVFEYVGSLAVKMALEAGYEIYDNHIIVWSDDDFGKQITKKFEALGATELIQTVNFDLLLNKISDNDFIFLADYSETNHYFTNSFFNLEEIKRLNPNVGIVHLYGEVSVNKYIENMKGMIYPMKDGKAKTMSFTLGHVGLNPIIKLQTAGLKVGESMLKSKETNLMQPVNF